MSIVNKKRMAEYLGKTQQTLTAWQIEGMPIKKVGNRGQSNEYDTKDVIKWAIEREINRVVFSENGQVYDYEKSKARLAHNQADKVGAEVIMMSRDLIKREDANEAWGKIVSAIKSKFLPLPDKLASQFARVDSTAKTREVLRRAIDECLEELSNESINLG